MIRLIFAELRAGWASWVGVIFVSAVTALACGVAISMLETGMQAGDANGFSGGTGAILMFSAPAGIAVTATITRLAVDLGRPAYALWQLAGVVPSQTALVVLTQIVVASFLGGMIGLFATTIIAEPAIQTAFGRGTGEYTETPIVTGPPTAFITIPAAVIIAIFGGLRAAHSAGRTPPLAALREPETEGKRMRWWRWLLLLATVTGAAAILAALFQAKDSSAVLTQGPLVPVVITAVLASGAPLLYSWVLRG